MQLQELFHRTQKNNYWSGVGAGMLATAAVAVTDLDILAIIVAIGVTVILVSELTNGGGS